MIDIQKHEFIMKKIFAEIYSSPELGPILGFKGGTCLYFFYNLKRFSTDLDFNLIADNFTPQLISQILSKYTNILEFKEKYFTWFWMGSYGKNNSKIKIEISKRDYPDEYENLDFYGLKTKVMTKDYIFADKLCAISDRKNFQNRDLYDTWLMFEQNFPVNEQIIKLRTGKNLKNYYLFLIDFIAKNLAEGKSILDGLGEALDDKQKTWVKDHLTQKLLLELKLRSS